MAWMGVPAALNNRLWARLRARNAVSSFMVFSKSARCSSLKGCTYLMIITSSGRGEYATKSGLTLMRYCISIVSKNFWSGTYSHWRPEDAHRREPVDVVAPESGLHRSHDASRPPPPEPAGLVGGGAGLASAAVCGQAGVCQADRLPGAGAQRRGYGPRRPHPSLVCAAPLHPFEGLGKAGGGPT